MSNIIPKVKQSFFKTIFQNSKDLAIDHGDIALDAIANNKIIEALPVVKIVAGVAQTGLAIRERHFANKLTVFLIEFHNNVVNGENVEKYKNYLQQDSKQKDRVMDNLIVHIDSYKTKEQAAILAHLFLAYLENKYSWERFLHLSISLDSLNPAGYDFMKELYDMGAMTTTMNIRDGEAHLVASGLAGRTGNSLRMTSLGVQLYEYGLRPYNQSR